jgi:hypothetical protein
MLGRIARTSTYAPVTGPGHAYVLVTVAHHTLGYVSPPVLHFTYIAKSATVLAQPRFNITGHNV